MFVFKKNSYVAMLIAKYAFRDCLLSLVCLVVIPISFAGCGCLYGGSTGVLPGCQTAGFFALYRVIVQWLEWFVKMDREIVM